MLKAERNSIRFTMTSYLDTPAASVNLGIMIVGTYLTVNSLNHQVGISSDSQAYEQSFSFNFPEELWELTLNNSCSFHLTILSRHLRA